MRRRDKSRRPLHYWGSRRPLHGRSPMEPPPLAPCGRYYFKATDLNPRQGHPVANATARQIPSPAPLLGLASPPPRAKPDGASPSRALWALLFQGDGFEPATRASRRECDGATNPVARSITGARVAPSTGEARRSLPLSRPVGATISRRR